MPQTLQVNVIFVVLPDELSKTMFPSKYETISDFLLRGTGTSNDHSRPARGTQLGNAIGGITAKNSSREWQ
jgi:hypothetical protein